MYASSNYIPSMPTGVFSYETALKRWEHAKPWRGDEDRSVRPIEPTRKRHMTIRREADGTIVCKLYDTDVVTWNPDNSVEIVPWSSKLTDAFAEALLPQAIRPRFNCLLGLCLEVHGVIYQIKSSQPTVLEQRDGVWVITSNTLVQFEREVVDRKTTKQLLAETNYTEFANWLKAARACGLPQGGLSTWQWEAMKPLDLLADRSKWMKFPKFDMATDTLLHKLRDTIYGKAEAGARRYENGTYVETTKTVYLDSITPSDLNKMRRAMLKDKTVRRMRGWRR